MWDSLAGIIEKYALASAARPTVISCASSGLKVPGEEAFTYPSFQS
jgi:hypothetical protein